MSETASYVRTPSSERKAEIVYGGEQPLEDEEVQRNAKKI
jgi:hypothetical protein